MLVAPYNDLDAVTAIVEEHHDSLAGVIVEAFQARDPAAARGFSKGFGP